MAKRSSSASWVLVILLLIGGAGGYYWWVQKRGGAQTVEYRASVAVKGDVVQTVSANGQLSPLVTVQVGSQVSGNVTKLYADFNTKVTNGQLVAELDPASYQSRMVQAENDLLNAVAQLNLTRVNVKRAQQLLANKLIPEADFDQLKAELEQRQAVVRMREAAVTNAAVDLARTKIFSPIDGTVISRAVDVGQTVQASFSAPTLFNIANDLAKMEIGAMVSEADIGGVEEGQDVSFTVEAFPSRTFRGRVSQVRNQPTTNQNVVTYATIIQVRNDDLKLKPGMTATVSITTSKREGVVRVPNGALRFRPPEGAVVRTNEAITLVKKTSGTNQAVAAVAGAKPEDDGIEFPNGSKPSPEMRQRILQRWDKNSDGRLDADEKVAWQESMQQRMAQGGSGGGGGGGRGPGGGGGGMFGGRGGGGEGGSGGAAASRPRNDSLPAIRTVYLIRTNMAPTGKTVELIPAQVRTGISDGSFTEVLEGLKAGDVLASGTVGAASAATAAPTANPFGGPFGGGRRF